MQHEGECSTENNLLHQMTLPGVKDHELQIAEKLRETVLVDGLKEST